MPLGFLIHTLSSIAINSSFSVIPALTPSSSTSSLSALEGAPLHLQPLSSGSSFMPHCIDDSTVCIGVDGHNLQSCDTYKQPHQTPIHSTNPFSEPPLNDLFTSPPRACMEGLLKSDEPWSLVGVEVPHFEDDAAYCADNAEATSMCSYLPLISHNTPSSLNIPHIHSITPPICDVSHTYVMSSRSDYVCVFASP
ncbi:hypothetical protein GOP47_0025151 [Adiantum capillus-veneris]|uniref:Uncharacterized protein n=1 Tax=Adiantum capillus-veneris TaxID=13818 RepID=A0A9D4Z5Q0_ADICA|nr:hypothetical protein GOP47_0024687 [Adiantum capillus-veneris]KAI5060731.1 hypothetical protein GOP47_0025151 [Adiantum capillus-veneris]